MRYLLVEAGAIEQLIQEQRLQTTDYDVGRRLVQLLRAEDVNQIVPSLRIVRSAQHDALLVSSRPDADHCLVIDLEQTAAFVHRPDSDVLTTFQRTLRFVFKAWQGMSFAACERVVTAKKGGRKYVLFPFPFGAATGWRLTLDRVTDLANGADHFLAYRWGRDEGSGPDELAPRGRLHLALAAFKKLVVRGTIEASVASSPPVSRPLEVVALDDVLDGRSALPYEAWIGRLTDPQMDFVGLPLEGPQRLEGAAGTGKTLALMLKAVRLLVEAEHKEREARAIFLTHSDATRKSIADKLLIIDHANHYQRRSSSDSAQFLEVTTLHQWCADRLGSTLSEVEFLDRDAAESKELQLLYVRESLDEAMRDDFATHEKFLSPEFVRFLRLEDAWLVSEMLGHEIAVMIKGRAGEEFTSYLALPPLLHNLPLNNDADRGFVFVMYRQYKNRLRAAGQYDTDDIVLTAMAQLDTPIWRRRRERDGYDVILVDETHLFNINELSLIHFLSRGNGLPPIAFAVDRSQAVGDRGFDRGIIEGTLAGEDMPKSSTLGTVFRSSREIVDLALSVTAGGASLFSNFSDPLRSVSSGFTEADERMARTPRLVECANDEDMLVRAEREAKEMAQRVPGGRAGVAVVIFDSMLLGRLGTTVRQRNRPFELITKRGDTEKISRARATSRFVLSSPELIGGLEFDGVVLVGVDEGRVPRETAGEGGEARHFTRYAAHNLLYVAITRARFEVCVLINRERGVSEILVPAVTERFLLPSS